VPNEATGAVVHELTRLEHELMEAVQRHDVERLEPMLGREFKLVGRTGRAWSRAEWLKNAAGSYEIDDFAFDEIDVDLYGDTAILHSRYRQTGRLAGEDLSHAFVLTDVWVRRYGRWQVVHRHSTIDPAG
jgi:ketosteroid isomerase-like protein